MGLGEDNQREGMGLPRNVTGHIFLSARLYSTHSVFTNGKRKSWEATNVFCNVRFKSELQHVHFSNRNGDSGLLHWAGMFPI